MVDEKTTPAPDVEVQMNFRIPGRMPGVYAHHMLVQPGPYEVTLSFFEVIPPVMLPGQSQEDNVKQLQETGLVAECVARVIIPNPRFAGFANAMQEIVTRITAKPAEASEAVPTETK